MDICYVQKTTACVCAFFFLPRLPDLVTLIELSASPHLKGNWSHVGVDLNSLNMLEKEIRTTRPSLTLWHRDKKGKGQKKVIANRFRSSFVKS